MESSLAIFRAFTVLRAAGRSVWYKAGAACGGLRSPWSDGWAPTAIVVCAIGLSVLAPPSQAVRQPVPSDSGSGSEVSLSSDAPDIARLRRLIESQQRGTIDEQDMEPALAAVASANSLRRRAVLARLGELESISFLRKVGRESVYEAWFANGRTIWGIVESPGGRISGLRSALREHR